MLAINPKGYFPYTPATNLLYGLAAALDMLFDEGLDNVFARHDRLAEATRRAVNAWGLEILCADPALYSSTLTGVLMPAGHDADAFRKIVLDRFDMSLGQGLGKVAGKVFRIGHLGHFNDLMLCGTLAGVEMGLAACRGSASQGRRAGRSRLPRRQAGSQGRGSAATHRHANNGGASLNTRMPKEDLYAHIRQNRGSIGGHARHRASRAAGDGMGADEAGRDRRRRGCRRRLRPDGADDAGRDPEEQPDEAADGRVAEGRRVRRRSADVHEGGRRRPEQGADRLLADLHAAALGQDAVQLARPDACVGHRARPVRAVGQHDARRTRT